MRPIGVFLTAIFLALATLILIFAGCALIFPSTPFEAIWNPARRALLMPYCAWLEPGFLLLSMAMAAGYRLAAFAIAPGDGGLPL